MLGFTHLRVSVPGAVAALGGWEYINCDGGWRV